MAKPKSGTSKINIDHLAKLANLPLSASEAKELESQLQETLSVVDQLNQVDTKNTKPTSQVTGLENVFRPDLIDSTRILTQEQALQNAPNTHQGYFVVPAVIDSDS